MKFADCCYWFCTRTFFEWSFYHAWQWGFSRSSFLGIGTLGRGAVFVGATSLGRQLRLANRERIQLELDHQEPIWWDMLGFWANRRLEAKYRITRNDPNFVPDLSEQQNCWENSPDLGSTQGGGGFDIIAAYFTNHGVVSETECPVDPNSANWDTPPGGYPFLATGWQSRVWKASSYQLNLATSSDVAANTAILKNAVRPPARYSWTSILPICTAPWPP